MTETSPAPLHRTTLYIDASLASDLKSVAMRRRCSVNSLIIEAIEALMAAEHDTSPDPAASKSPGETVLALRRDLDRLHDRVRKVEALVHGRRGGGERDEDRPLLRADEVRREARTLIVERGAPIPHRELLDALEARFVLPGKDTSENLRTILVHPKTRGFVLIRGKGYDLER